MFRGSYSIVLKAYEQWGSWRYKNELTKTNPIYISNESVTKGLSKTDKLQLEFKSLGTKFGRSRSKFETISSYGVSDQCEIANGIPYGWKKNGKKMGKNKKYKFRRFFL